MKQFPKILILSRGFRAGDAITILNLFSQFPKEQLFCASLLESEFISYFNEYYVFGSDEVKFHFPFTYLAHKSKSHVASANIMVSDVGSSGESLIHKVYKRTVLPLLQRLDMYETRYSMNLSNLFLDWLHKISPDIIYTSIGDIPTARLVLSICMQFPDIKIVVHCFDDWLNPTYKIWNVQKHYLFAEKLLMQILDSATLRFASSEKMAIEYKERYGYDFRCFTNPVKIHTSLTDIKKSETPNILFAGKVGWHNNTAIRDMMKAVEHLNRIGIVLRFDLYTDCSPEQIAFFLGNVPETTILHKPVLNSRILEILSASHILFLPISITAHTERFTRYSMSTKMGEYIASGIPVLYCGPSTIAMTEFLKSNKCAVVIEECGPQALWEGIMKCLKKDEEIVKMTQIGLKLAHLYFDIDIVSEKFAKALLDV